MPGAPRGRWCGGCLRALPTGVGGEAVEHASRADRGELLAVADRDQLRAGLLDEPGEGVQACDGRPSRPRPGTRSCSGRSLALPASARAVRASIVDVRPASAGVVSRVALPWSRTRRPRSCGAPACFSARAAMSITTPFPVPAGPTSTAALITRDRSEGRGLLRRGRSRELLCDLADRPCAWRSPTSLPPGAASCWARRSIACS